MYRQVNTKIWHDPKVKSLSVKDKLLFVYLLTNNHTHMSGIYYMPIPIIEHETGLKKTEIIKGMHTLSIPYLVAMDTGSEVVWVVNMLKYQGKSDKVAKAAATQLETLHNSPIIKDFLKYYDTLSIPYAYPIDTLPIPDHKGIEVGIDLGIDLGEGIEGEEKTRTLSPLATLWNEICPSLPKTIISTNGRLRKEKTRLKEMPLGAWHEVFALIESSDFCRGENNRGWQASYDWIIEKQENAVKVLEGKYKKAEKKTHIDHINESLENFK